jgi:cyclophilin family peptidyl-prolyl cis-trans isomerase/HEAT repeat protein
MKRARSTWTHFRTVLLVTACSACVPDSAPRDRALDAYLRIVDAEDARPEDGPRLDVLLQSAAAGDRFIRASAIRALGRLENPNFAPVIRDALSDPSRDVRLEAAYALAQAHNVDDGTPAFQPLRDRLEIETDPAVRSELGRSIGRLRLSAEHQAERVELLLTLTRQGDGDAPTETLVGALLGIEAIARASGADIPARSRLARRMRELASYNGDFFLSEESVRVRKLALTVLGQSGLMDTPTLQRALRDAAHLVPAAAVRYLSQIPMTSRPETLRRAVTNESLPAVIEAFRYIASSPRTEQTCTLLLAGARVTPPESPRPVPEPIRVMAIDGLSEPCADLESQRTVLREVVESLDDGAVRWQAPAHALLSLARLFPTDAGDYVSGHADHANPFVRAYAARAAALLGDREGLLTLAGDQSDNVRTAAIEGLFALDGHAVDGVLLVQLDRDDPQLLLTAARMLEGTNRVDAASRLLEAFGRISEARRETWRDARAALLARLTEVGGPAQSEDLIPYLTDYDEQIATAVAGALRRWNGRPYTPTPLALPREPIPNRDEMRAMDGARVVLHMEGGARIEIALEPFISTTNTYRFWRLAREGYFDGLTFHRWAPNFVIQGGSPGANEYQGDGPYTRDEVGRAAHWRGTVGISTRGHDTGDGQIFVNLVDNVRLDHTYTIVGSVVEGMEAVDGVLEGAVIERAEVVPGS